MPFGTHDGQTPHPTTARGGMPAAPTPASPLVLTQKTLPARPRCVRTIRKRPETRGPHLGRCAQGTPVLTRQERRWGPGGPPAACRCGCKETIQMLKNHSSKPATEKPEIPSSKSTAARTNCQRVWGCVWGLQVWPPAAGVWVGPSGRWGPGFELPGDDGKGQGAQGGGPTAGRAPRTPPQAPRLLGAGP